MANQIAIGTASPEARNAVLADERRMRSRLVRPSVSFAVMRTRLFAFRAERAAIIEPDDFDMHYNLACAFALLGEKAWHSKGWSASWGPQR
jgi:hypothetical protein